MKRNALRTRLNKKGITDIIYVVITGIVIILTIVIGYKIMTAFNNQIQDTESITVEAKEIYSITKEKYEGTMDTFFIMVYFIIYIAALISAWFIDTHPVFFVLSVIVLVLLLVGIVPMVKMTEEMVSQSELLDTGWTNQFPIMSFVVNHFFAIIVIQAMLLIIVMYAKTRSGL